MLSSRHSGDTCSDVDIVKSSLSPDSMQSGHENMQVKVKYLIESIQGQNCKVENWKIVRRIHTRVKVEVR